MANVLDIPDQPDGIGYDRNDLPEVENAARRVRAYVTEFGDGLYDTCAGAPLYGRDLEALCRGVERLQAELTTLRASLRAIHQPFEGRCTECVEGCDCPGEHTCTHDNVPWPCRTAVAAGISENISSNATGGER